MAACFVQGVRDMPPVVKIYCIPKLFKSTLWGKLTGYKKKEKRQKERLKYSKFLIGDILFHKVQYPLSMISIRWP